MILKKPNHENSSEEGYRFGLTAESTKHIECILYSFIRWSVSLVATRGDRVAEENKVH